MDKSAWELHTDATKDQFDSKLITLGPWTSFSFLSDPKHVSFVLARYKFVSKMLADKSTILEIGCGDGVGFKIKHNQRLISSWNHSPMGFSLPAAIGASFANPRKTINCIIGDGGLMMCLQELGTVARHNLPINIFIFNNRGHGIQKQTIDTWLNGNQIGVDHETGLFFPNFELIADSFGIAYEKITHINQAIEKINPVSSKPVIYDVMINPEQKIFPMLKFGGNLTDLDNLIPKPRYLQN